ncbi:MAG: flagellar hook assembly protein FlgD [Bacteroidota bacterium]
MDGVTSTSQTTNSQPANAKGKASLGKNDFLNLMMAQLKYQNPLDPMDGTEYAAQLAQFSSLEQMTNMNDTLEQSIDTNYLLAQSVNNTMSATLIGKEVKISGKTIKYSGEDSISIGYKLPADAKSMTITIKDSNGAIVKTIESSELSQGDHKLSWDFTDNNGKKVKQGTYSYTIASKSTSGKDLTITASLYGKVSAVKFTDEGTKLVIGSSEYLLSDISEITGG